MLTTLIETGFKLWTTVLKATANYLLYLFIEQCIWVTFDLVNICFKQNNIGELIEIISKYFVWK